MSLATLRKWVLFVVAHAAACGADVPFIADDVASTPDIPDVAVASAGAGADKADTASDRRPRLDLYALDIWGQSLPATSQITIKRNGTAIPGFVFPATAFPLAAGRYTIQLRAEHHEPLDASFTFGGTSAELSRPLSVTLDAGNARHGLSQLRESRALSAGATPVPVFKLFLGLRHKWFSAEGRPARRRNSVRLIMNGEDYWNRVAAEIARARESIHASVWWWESDFELTRNPATHLRLTESERRANTILSLLDASPAQKRVLVGQFIGQDSRATNWITTDAALRAKGATAGDRFEFMGQANPTSGTVRIAPRSFRFSDRIKATLSWAATRAFEPETSIPSSLPARTTNLNHWPFGVDFPSASHHQKFFVVDGARALISGMNIMSVDWDTSAHRVFEPRRVEFETSRSAREAIRDKKAPSDLPPRRDYGVAIEGPIVEDAAEIFKLRWDANIAAGAEHASRSSSFTVKRGVPAVTGGVQAQVTATLPEPWNEHAIYETKLNAIRRAEKFIFIEDQYFRSTILNDAIRARMREVPTLKFLVLTMAVSEWKNPACAWTARNHANFVSEFPGRVRFYQLRAFDTSLTWGIDETKGHFVEVDDHSKVLIVDDVFMTVGSANHNNRSQLYDSELNVAVVDRPWVRAARRQIMASLLPSTMEASDDVARWWWQFEYAAWWNDATYASWKAERGDINLNGAALPSAYTPSGLVHSLSFRAPSDCFFEDVGDDNI